MLFRSKAQQGGKDDAPVEMAKHAELEELRSGMNDLRARIEAIQTTLDATQGASSTLPPSVDALRRELVAMREDFLTLASEPKSGAHMDELEALRAETRASLAEFGTASLTEIEGLKRDIVRLTQAVDAAHASSPDEVAELRASVRALIVLVSQSMGRERAAA